MKQSRPYTALALVALTSALILGACGGNKQEAAASSSSAKTSQSTKMSSSSINTKTEKKTPSASSGEMKEEAPASQESQPAKQTEQAKENKKQDSATMAKEDATKVESNQSPSEFAKFAGTWTNDEGKTVVFNPDGTTPEGHRLEGGEEQDNGIYTAGIRSPEGFGANFYYAPAGQAFPESMAPKEFVNTDGTDISRERIVIAQSVDRMAHPYYRAE